MGLLDFKLGDVGGVITSLREAITGEKITDPAELARIELELQNLELKMNEGQIAINKIEASSGNLFIAGWRPFIGWVCGFAIAYAFVGQPILEWMVNIFEVTQTYTNENGVSFEVPLTAPDIDNETLFELVIAMLGMATLRTYEKKHKVNRNSI